MPEQKKPYVLAVLIGKYAPTSRVFINKGIPLSIALDIIMDILDILTEIGGENHG